LGGNPSFDLGCPDVSGFLGDAGNHIKDRAQRQCLGRLVLVGPSTIGRLLVLLSTPAILIVSLGRQPPI
jgi:hypothetical protein